MSELTDALDAICRLLSTGPSAATVASELGEVVEAQVSAIEVRPRDQRFGDTYVIHDGDGVAMHVDLSLHAPSTLDELAAAFGEYREARRRYPAPRSFHFKVGGCTLIASVSDDVVSAVTVRRDT